MKNKLFENQNCGQCRFFQQSEDDKKVELIGLCRRFPPIPVTILTGGTAPTIIGTQIKNAPQITTQVRAVFPTMQTSDPGCGEFKI